MQSHGLTAIAQLSTDELMLLVDLDETVAIGGSVSILLFIYKNKINF